jgi:hypothetical protein
MNYDRRDDSFSPRSGPSGANELKAAAFSIERLNRRAITFSSRMKAKTAVFSLLCLNPLCSSPDHELPAARDAAHFPSASQDNFEVMEGVLH